MTVCQSLKTAQRQTSNSMLFVLALLLTFKPSLADQIPVTGYNTVSLDRLSALQASARQLYNLGQFDQALSTYNELFIAVRLNDGLFAEQQLPVLERLLAVNIELSAWDSLNQYLDYHEWLTHRLFSNNPVALAEQLQVNSLHRHNAASRLEGPQRSWHLVQARTQLWRAVSALETMPAEADRLPPLWLKIANYHYELTHGSQRWLTSFENRTDEPVMISGWALGGDEVEQRSYEIGAELLQKISTYYMSRELPPGIDRHISDARLITLQGDWELLFDQPQEASQFYRQALRIASQSACPVEIRDALFGQTVMLPVTDLGFGSSSCSDISLNADGIPAGLVAGGSGSERYRPHWSMLGDLDE